MVKSEKHTNRQTIIHTTLHRPNENDGQLGCLRKSFKIAFQNDCIYSTCN